MSSNWDKIITSSPIDKTAAVVASLGDDEDGNEREEWQWPWSKEQEQFVRAALTLDIRKLASSEDLLLARETVINARNLIDWMRDLMKAQAGNGSHLQTIQRRKMQQNKLLEQNKVLLRKLTSIHGKHANAKGQLEAKARFLALTANQTLR